MLRELNEYFPLAGQILTADALHTQDDFAKLAREELNAHFVLTVKGNRKNLYAALEALCWAGAARHVTRDKGHGREETRSHLVMDAPEEIKALIPHVRQVAKVHRVRTVRYWKGNGSTWKLVTKTTRETVYLVTSLTAREAGPEHIAVYIRSHWGIENEVHWERDTTLREDDCKVRAQNRPRNLATLRNLLGGLCHQHGFDGTAATIREAEYDKDLLTAITRLSQPREQRQYFGRSPAIQYRSLQGITGLNGDHDSRRKQRCCGAGRGEPDFSATLEGIVGIDAGQSCDHDRVPAARPAYDRFAVRGRMGGLRRDGAEPPRAHAGRCPRRPVGSEASHAGQ